MQRSENYEKYLTIIYYIWTDRLELCSSAQFGCLTHVGIAATLWLRDAMTSPSSLFLGSFFFFVRVSSFFRKKFISKSVQLVKSQLKCNNSRSNDGGLYFLVIKNDVSKV